MFISFFFLFLRITSRVRCNNEFTDLDSFLNSRRSRTIKNLNNEKDTTDNNQSKISEQNLTSDAQLDKNTSDYKKKVILQRRRKFLSPALRVQTMMEEKDDAEK